MPTTEERAAHDIPEGVPVFTVATPAGELAMYAADRYRLRTPRG